MLPHLHAAPHLHPTPQLQSDQGHLPDAFGEKGGDGVSAVSGRQRGRGPRLGKCTRLSVTSHERGGTRSERRPASREDADEDTHRARRQRLCCRSCCRNRRKGYRTSSSCACVAHGRASEWPTEKRATDNDPDARDDGISVPRRKKRCRQRRCRRHSSARSLGLAGDSCSRDRMERRALAPNVASTRAPPRRRRPLFHPATSSRQLSAFIIYSPLVVVHILKGYVRVCSYVRKYLRSFVRSYGTLFHTVRS